MDTKNRSHDMRQATDQCTSRIDLEALADEIGRLRLEIDAMQGKDCSVYKTLINLAFAERAARAGQPTNAVAHLTMAKKVLSVATRMGLTTIIKTLEFVLPEVSARRDHTTSNQIEPDADEGSVSV